MLLKVTYLIQFKNQIFLYLLSSRLGSQFFITLGDNLDYLDKEHCVFGEVVEGHETLLNINDAICDEKHIPYQDIRYVASDRFDSIFSILIFFHSGLLIPSYWKILSQIHLVCIRLIDLRSTPKICARQVSKLNVKYCIFQHLLFTLDWKNRC